MYIAPGMGRQSLRDKMLMSTDTSCHFGHLWLVSSIKQLSYIFPEEMYIFPYKSIRKQIWPCCKKGQGQPRAIIWTKCIGPKSSIRHTESQGHWPFGSKEEGFQKFYHIWAWRPSWSCNLDPLNKLSLPWHMEATYQISQRFLRRCLKSVDDGRTDDGACLYYKLTHAPKGSGELKYAYKMSHVRGQLCYVGQMGQLCYVV